jgi:hypothetical protein
MKNLFRCFFVLAALVLLPVSDSIAQCAGCFVFNTTSCGVFNSPYNPTPWPNIGDNTPPCPADPCARPFYDCGMEFNDSTCPQNEWNQARSIPETAPVGKKNGFSIKQQVDEHGVPLFFDCAWRKRCSQCKEEQGGASVCVVQRMPTLSIGLFEICKNASNQPIKCDGVGNPE